MGMLEDGGQTYTTLRFRDLGLVEEPLVVRETETLREREGELHSSNTLKNTKLPNADF